MKTDNLVERRRSRTWLRAEDCRVEDLAALTERGTDLAEHPFASAVEGRVPVYDGDMVRRAVADPADRHALMAEWAGVFAEGAGIVVLRGAFDDTRVVDRVTVAFEAMIAEQHRAGTGAGDHFARPGANDRVWNALEKLCLRDPEGFAAYYGNPVIALACEAWLGPAYQVTSQVNRVNPGGAAQSAHRDYHLGFQGPSVAAGYPAHVHRMSPMLTLQGAVAHCDMPRHSGPTLYLPYSQLYEPGYLATALPEFATWFDAHHEQAELRKGDAAFFNPAVIHAAGHNRSADILRLANLLQVSSAYGRAMESVDRTRMSLALYPALRAMRAAGRLDAAQSACAVAACAEGYAFPTDLDRDPPIGGLAPESQRSLMLRALEGGYDDATFAAALRSQAARRGG